MDKIPKNINVYDVIKIIIALFFLYIIIQIINKELGGSWSTEDIIIALIVLNLSISFTVYGLLQKHLGEHKIRDNQFRAFTRDFKEHIKKHKK